MAEFMADVPPSSPPSHPPMERPELRDQRINGCAAERENERAKVQTTPTSPTWARQLWLNHLDP
eukprot:4455680-Pleurochrysis_carterae.AAC.1